MSCPVLKIEVWIAHLDELKFAPFSADFSLTESISNPQLKLRRARSKSFLRRVLGRRLFLDPEDVWFQLPAGGKPSVNGCEFSISHSGPWLVVAIGTVPIGVDIETNAPHRDPMDLAERFFHVADTTALRHTATPGRESHFLRQWVAKEAASKASGTGLGGHLHNARCDFENAKIRAVEWNAEHFAIHEFALSDGTPAALAWAGKAAAEVEWRLPAEAGIS